MGTSSGENNSVGASESLGPCRKSDALEKEEMLFFHRAPAVSRCSAVRVS